MQSQKERRYTDKNGGVLLHDIVNLGTPSALHSSRPSAVTRVAAGDSTIISTNHLLPAVYQALAINYLILP